MGTRLDARYTDPLTGERKRCRHIYDSERAAGAAQASVLQRIEAGLPPFGEFAPQLTPLTVAELLDYYETSHGPDARPLSLERMKEFRRHLEARLGRLRVEALTFDVLARYRRERMSDRARPKSKLFKGTVGQVTVKKELSHLRAACRYGLALGKVNAHPFERLTREQRRLLFPSEESKGRVLTDQEFEKILYHVRPFYRDALRFARLAGLRKGELCGLRWEGVKGDVLVVGESKTGARAVPLTEGMRRLLPPRSIRGGVIFESPWGRSLYNALNSAWYEARGKAGIPDARIHDLRHSAATEMLDYTDAGAVGEVLGMSAATIQRYDHARFDRARAAFEKMHSKPGANRATVGGDARES